jgi:hypothetical protein
MKQDVRDLLDKLNAAITDAICNDDVLCAIANVEEAVGNVRSSIDVFLPSVTDFELKPFAESGETDYDVQFLRSMKI